MLRLSLYFPKHQKIMKMNQNSQRYLVFSLGLDVARSGSVRGLSVGNAHPLTKKRCNCVIFALFFMILGVLESWGVDATCAFGSKEKHTVSKKLELKIYIKNHKFLIFWFSKSRKKLKKIQFFSSKKKWRKKVEKKVCLQKSKIHALG